MIKRMLKDSDGRDIPLIKVIFNLIAPFLAILVLFIIWIIASTINPELVPNPIQVWNRLILLFQKPISNANIFGHILASLRRVCIALVAAAIIGIPFGVMIGWSKTLNAIFGTLFEILRPIPPIAWLPLVIMWYGIGEFPKILIVFIGTVMPIVINTSAGIKFIDPINIDVGRMFHANNRQLLLEVAVPSALPAIFAGLRNATSTGWMVVLAGELIGAKRGVGFLINRGMEFFDIPLILVGMIAIGLVGALLSIITDYLESWICPWNQKLNID